MVPSIPAKIATGPNERPIGCTSYGIGWTSTINVPKECTPTYERLLDRIDECDLRWAWEVNRKFGVDLLG